MESEPVSRTIALALGLLGEARANGGRVQEVRDPPTPLDVLVRLLSPRGATALISKIVETGGEPAEVLEAGLLLLGEGGGLRRFQEWKRSGILGLPADPVEAERVLDARQAEKMERLRAERVEREAREAEAAEFAAKRTRETEAEQKALRHLREAQRESDARNAREAFEREARERMARE
ncbi:MAG: hypothetical protein HY720_03855 [Planctomycetes bacterium]|nr:hypothetical protein [Planctomycetota bacterium]